MQIYVLTKPMTKTSSSCESWSKHLWVWHLKTHWPPNLQGFYPLRLCHHCHRSYWASGFYRQQQRGWSLPGWTSVEWRRELPNFTKVFFTLNNCEQSIPLMFLLLKNWRISLRWLRFFGCLFLLKLLFLLFLLILRYEVSVPPRS